MAIEPAAISARPAVTTIPLDATAPLSPAASANGTVRPSAMPMTMSRTISLEVKWRSTCRVCGMARTLCADSRGGAFANVGDQPRHVEGLGVHVEDAGDGLASQ